MNRESIEEKLKSDCWTKYNFMDHYENDVLDRDGNGKSYHIYLYDGYLTQDIYEYIEDSMEPHSLESTVVNYDEFEKWYSENH